ncbi:MAG: serine protease [Gammaproteobacteria bacterium]|nr:serine protease [Gammaproteobacteria bacterium]
MPNNFPQFEPHPHINSSIYEVALRLAAFDANDKFYATGTSVAIAGNLLLAAKHVIDDFLKEFNCSYNEKANITIWAVQITNDKDLYAIWECTEIFSWENSDIAILRIAPLNDIAAKRKALTSCQLSFLPPKQGDNIVAFGYKGLSRDSCKITRDGTGTKHFDIQDEPHVTTGKILDVYNNVKNPSRIPAPCFATEARVDGGMSGGPVFTENGLLCGILSTSFDVTDGELNTSFVSLLWPMLAIKLPLSKDRGSQTTEYSIQELVQKGLISGTGWEHFIINEKLGFISPPEEDNDQALAKYGWMTSTFIL